MKLTQNEYEELEEYLDELRYIVSEIDDAIKVKIMEDVTVLLIILGGIAAFALIENMIIGYFAMLGIWLVLYIYIFDKRKPVKPTYKEISKEAIDLIDKSLQVIDTAGDWHGEVGFRHIRSHRNKKDNIVLYERFIAFFPQFSSKKLKRLISINS